MIRMKIPELLLVCIICVAVSKSTEDIKYALTFQATGCPNKNPAVTWWKTFSYDNTVFNDMFDRCALVRDGTETAYLKTECCGEGYDCKPITCNKQTTWTTDPTTAPAPTTPNVAAVIDTVQQTEGPTEAPTEGPTEAPTEEPTEGPSSDPTTTPAPTTPNVAAVVEEHGKFCDPRVSTSWINEVEAKQECQLNSECSMFWKGCTGVYYYCTAPTTVYSSSCTILYSPGSCFADDNMWQDWSGTNCQYYATNSIERCGEYNQFSSSFPGYPETNPCCACEGCVDTAQGITDGIGAGCDNYKTYPNWCGRLDTNEFKAQLMCCACKETDPKTTPAPTTPNDAAVIDITYVANKNGQRCCLATGNPHRLCIYDNLEQPECKQKCSDDPKCKGFYMIFYGFSGCELSTSSTCTKRGPYGADVGPLDDNTRCNKEPTSPCYIKQTQDPTTTPTTPNVAAVIVPYFVQLGTGLCTGTDIIDTKEECKVALRLLTYKGYYLYFAQTLSNVDYPKGCFMHEGTLQVFWNAIRSGRESSESHPICKKDPTATPTTPNVAAVIEICLFQDGMNIAEIDVMVGVTIKEQECASLVKRMKPDALGAALYGSDCYAVYGRDVFGTSGRHCFFDPTTTPAPTTPNVAAVVDSYWITEWGENCPADYVVLDELSCRDAAVELGILYLDEYTDDVGMPAGCFKTTGVLFNHKTDPSTTPVPYSAGICRSVPAMDDEESQGGSSEDEDSNVEDEEDDDEDDEDEEVDDDDDDDLYGTEREITRDFIPMREEEFRGRDLLSILSFLPVPKILVALGEMF